MKKLFFVFIIGLLTACATNNQQQPLPVTQLDVESLNKDIDLEMDISQLRLSDLNILRNAFAAQKGFPFRDSYLRSIYASTTWYDSLMWNFDDTEEFFNHAEYDNNMSYRDNYYGSIKPEVMAYTPEQQAFIDRIEQRMEELQVLNFKSDYGRVNMQNVMNPALVDSMDVRLYQRLGENGFAIVPAKHQQLFHLYEQNDYHEFPSFVTTDLYLQLYHLYFDCMLREIEQHCFLGNISSFCKELDKTIATSGGALDSDVKQWLSTYLTVAQSLLSGQEPSGDATALEEYQKVMKSEDNFSSYLGYTDAKFAYSLFRPRGHYTRNETLQRYFRAMMWLQTVPFQTDNEQDMKKAFALAETIGSNTRLTTLYNKFYEPMTWLMGQPDDVSIMQVWQVMQEESDFTKRCKKIDEIAENQTRIRPKFQHTSKYKVRLMPQRYQPDAEVLQEMVDYDNLPTKRDVPKGLDFMAAMRVTAAEKILMDELNEGSQWEGFEPALKQMQKRMDSINWDENAAVKWMSTLKTVIDKPQNAPYFMLTDAWDRKSLNAALASWTELKHDAILYAKQPFGAECGGGGPPDPVVKGYVEPNVNFWKKAIELLNNTKDILAKYDLTNEKILRAHTQLCEQAEFLLGISEKELQGEVLADEEYDQLEYIGATYENISLDLLRDADHEIWDWESIQGPDRKVALVADVYTANADNNPNKSILFEAIGDADEIYVVVEIGGRLYLTRGAVFSYREFQRSINDQRLNDEEWQQYLEQHPREGVPSWMTPVIVPLDNAPVDNESVFYSSGC